MREIESNHKRLQNETYRPQQTKDTDCSRGSLGKAIATHSIIILIETRVVRSETGIADLCPQGSDLLLGGGSRRVIDDPRSLPIDIRLKSIFQSVEQIAKLWRRISEDEVAAKCCDLLFERHRSTSPSFGCTTVERPGESVG